MQPRKMKLHHVIYIAVLAGFGVVSSCAFSPPSAPSSWRRTRAWGIPKKCTTITNCFKHNNHKHSHNGRSTATALWMNYNVRKSKHVHRHDDWYMAALEARVCASSSSSTDQEAEDCLNEMIGMQAGCITGSVDPMSDVCTDPLWIADIVDELRHKLGYSGPVEGYEQDQSHESKGYVCTGTGTGNVGVRRPPRQRNANICCMVALRKV
jgi:hypothetical protein